MSEVLRKGLILKSKTYEEGETFYTIIIKRRLFLPWMHKTARLYKNWKYESGDLEVAVNQWDSRNYEKDIYEGNLESPSKEETEILEKDIENLSPHIRAKVYGKKKFRLFHSGDYDIAYGFEMQKIANIDSTFKDSSKDISRDLSRDLSDKFYKKALSFTNILHL